MKVDNMVRAQVSHNQTIQHHSMSSHAMLPESAPSAPPSAHMYPALGDYMGLELSPQVIALNMPEYQVQTVSNIRNNCSFTIYTKILTLESKALYFL